MRRSLMYSLAFVSMIALAACAPPPAATTGTADDEVAIRGIGTKFAEAWNKGDVAGMSALRTEDFESVAPDGTTTKGREAADAREKESLTARAGLPLTLSVQTTMVKWTGASSAAIAGTWTVAGVPAGMGGDKGSWSGTVVKGADGQWRMVTGLVAEYVPPPAPPAAAPVPAGKGK